MSELDLAEFRAEMERERTWRETELRQLRNQVSLLPSEDQRKTARKALVVMLYAHFEGVSKALLSMYVKRINNSGLRVDEVVPPIGAASLAEVFSALRDPNTKCKVFGKQLPDDTALHRFARDREFVEVAWKIAERSVQIDADKVVDAESNLKPVVLKKILFRLGLDPDLAKPWEGTIHCLLNHRNTVAHGTARFGLDAKLFEELERAVWSVVGEIVKAVFDAAAGKAYLTSKAQRLAGGAATGPAGEG
ncbi:MAG: hypothetical protein IPK71_29460 [Myxococcales bacterium]|nr:hypothetical protein [Myxococcales bacterium]